MPKCNRTDKNRRFIRKNSFNNHFINFASIITLKPVTTKESQKPAYPLLENAPIVEALLDIQVQLPEGKDLNALHKVFDVVKDKYPTEKKRFAFSGKIEFKAQETQAKSSISETQVDGYLFYSEDKTKVFQARLSGFTFNKHKPYKSWNALKKEAKELWTLYKKIAEPLTINRIALRYINKIPLKIPFTPTSYFTTLPYLAKGLDYDMNNLFSQISIMNNQLNARATITEAVELTNSDTALFLFDIDVFQQGDFAESEIWKNFESLRDFKNEIFFKSITAKTLKLIE
ncbi:MAG TPA: TIGR04255 family protein [Bacteroides sp.]|nr:TIGR04255 family protein [Bacteroides sp.]